MKKIKNLYLLLATLCCVLLCIFSPAYFTSGEDAGHYFTLHFASLDAMTYDTAGHLVADDAFAYQIVETGETVTGAHLMSVWAMPVLALAIALLCVVDLFIGIFAGKVDHLLLQARLNFATLICALGYYAMLALYIFFACAKFDLDWHLTWSAGLPLVVLILVLMTIRAISAEAKKIMHDLRGSIR